MLKEVAKKAWETKKVVAFKITETSKNCLYCANSMIDHTQCALWYDVSSLNDDLPYDKSASGVA